MGNTIFNDTRFLQCPRKFKYSYIDKLPRKNTDKTALYKGLALHNILEKYPEVGTHKLTTKYQYIIDKFLKSKYIHYLKRQSVKELGIGLSDTLEPMSYSKKAMFRGYIDYFTIIDGVMHILDYKSGKLKEHKYQDFTQLMYYAIYMFKKYTKLDTIKLSYVYIEHDVDNSITLKRKYLHNYTKDLLTTIKEVEISEYNKTKTLLCKFCDYQDFCSKNI